ncbi:CRAL/TRIO domain-containing protein [Mycena sanguinolenta]|uniref:CRAL/TRIO domain-containing protein n=1 Tax=Mycena sanguinolenta TaxID=230812 RepID=A0A8H7DMF9_9AGAR|nr:CRAL/TRIO domain-containing protein [Mycena sanguinolenta]
MKAESDRSHRTGVFKLRFGKIRILKTRELFPPRPPNPPVPVLRDWRGKHMDLIANANREKFKLLSSQYAENLEAVLALQGTVIDDLLPSVTDEFELDTESTQWAKEWLNDMCTLFRILRRNKFTRSFAIESIRKTLVWRFEHLWPPDPALRLPFVHCLPPPATDPFGRPILVMKVVSFNESSEGYKPLIIRGLECLRLHLIRLNEDSHRSGTPVLQYVILLDLKGLSTQSLNIDLVTWTLRDAIPKFPGLLAAAFMINYSWTHAGLWAIAKRVLPEKAISRVFFPTQQQLADYFSPAMLPKDYGGTLASLTELHDPLWTDSPSPEVGASGETSSSTPSIVAAAPSITAIAPTSHLNPFFGYPVFSSGGLPALHYGRRRKRDLVRTLLILAWRRWRRHIMACIWVLMFILTIRGRRAWFIQTLQRGKSIWTVTYRPAALL